MILIVIWFDDLYVSCQHLVHFDVWWHHGVCVCTSTSVTEVFSAICDDSRISCYPLFLFFLHRC